MAADVVMVGSVAYDSVETPHGKVERALGGAATFAGTAASFFARVGLVGVVGEDFEPEHIAFLQSRGIDTAGITREAGLTFHWSGRYHANLNDRDTLATELNVFESFDPVLPEAYRQAPYLFLANIQPTLQLKVLDQMAGPRFVALDTMNLWIDIARDDLEQVTRRVDLLLINDSEAALWTGCGNPIEAARQLIGLGPQAVVIKKGEHGAMLVSADRVFVLPAFPVAKVVDPTGCGDTFAGALIGYVASCGSHDEATLRQAMVYGTMVASFNVEDFSLDRLRSLSRTDLDARLAEFHQMCAFAPPV